MSEIGLQFNVNTIKVLYRIFLQHQFSLRAQFGQAAPWIIPNFRWLSKRANADVSSAKRTDSWGRLDGRSLIIMTNRSGPKTDPWGTPLTTSRIPDTPITTTCFLFTR
ncbi:uncharacterized protein LOC124368930 isoform X2 [Homalodisca vitripennis]|nr:uncharacterized protein LOC124368930 isoform X2 [Homalodisca vitripennis]